MGFRAKTLQEAREKFKPLARSPMKRGVPMKQGKLINKAGPKTKAWNVVRAELKIEFENVYGVTACELRYAGCWFDNALGFAHAEKRRKLSSEDLKHVILCCGPCHDQIEFLSPGEMKRIVDETVYNRATVAADRMFSE